MKKIYFMFLVGIFHSCIIDRIYPFCFIHNDTHTKVSIFFSNSQRLDSATFLKQYATYVLSSDSTLEIFKQGDIFFKEGYTNQIDKKLFIHFLNFDSAQKIFQNREVIKYNLNDYVLKVETIDVFSIKATDTIFFKP